MASTPDLTRAWNAWTSKMGGVTNGNVSLLAHDAEVIVSLRLRIAWCVLVMWN